MADNAKTFTREELECPITKEIMIDPVKTPRGVYFERSAIIHWLQNNNTCPMTRDNMDVDDLEEAPEMVLAINEFKSAQTRNQQAREARLLFFEGELVPDEDAEQSEHENEDDSEREVLTVEVEATRLRPESPIVPEPIEQDEPFINPLISTNLAGHDHRLVSDEVFDARTRRAIIESLAEHQSVLDTDNDDNLQTQYTGTPLSEVEEDHDREVEQQHLGENAQLSNAPRQQFLSTTYGEIDLGGIQSTNDLSAAQQAWMRHVQQQMAELVEMHHSQGGTVHCEYNSEFIESITSPDGRTVSKKMKASLRR